MREIKKIIIHCAATRPGMDVGVREIRDWHVKGNGWADIGYHYVIRRNGALEAGRPLELAGAHTAGHNADSIGVCLVGGVAEDGKTAENNFTAAQWNRLQSLVHVLRRRFHNAAVHGHNEFCGRACPSFDVRAWLEGVV